MNELYRLDGDTIHFPAKSVTLPLPIAKAEKLASVVVVLLEIPKAVKMNENVYGISLDGEILWQVSAREHVYADSPYTGMKPANRDHITLFNWDGLELTVDGTTGRPISEKWGM